MPFDEGVIVVDEASMMDSWLAAALIRFVRGSIVLVGDESQLPPVSPGSPFHDLVEIRPKLVVRLSICHRASAAVHIASNMIRAGKVPPALLRSDGEVWHVKETGSPAATMNAISRYVESGQYDPEQDVFIAPSYGQDDDNGHGIHAINNRIKAHIIGDTGNKWDVGDRIMITKNFPQEDLWNGDAGKITHIAKQITICLDRERGACHADDLTRTLTDAQCRNMVLAYCISVHKSQGSQYRRVFFVCLHNQFRMLDRALVYTAITRAREGCCVIGNINAFAKSINITRARETCLRLFDGLDPEADVLRAGRDKATG